MKAIIRNKKGMTLIELLLALAIVSVVMAAAFTILATGMKTYNIDKNSSIGQGSLRGAMITITKTVRKAPAGAASITGIKVLTVSSKSFTIDSGNLKYGGVVIANNIASIYADYTDATHTVIQVDLTSTDGNTLSTQVRVN
jgi:prepilin-type N-terminal cleavage/methylation domain-containing protein